MLTSIQRNTEADQPEQTHSHEQSEYSAEHLEEHARMERLIAENRALLEAEQRRGRQFALVAEVSRKVASILDLDQMLAETVDLMSGSFGADQVSIHLLDPNDEGIIFVAASSTTITSDGSPRIIPGMGMIGWVAQHGKPRLANDVEKDPVFFRAPGLNTGSELALPLISASRVIGVLNLESDERDAFAPDEVPILETLAEQIAIAIQNSRLNAQARELAVYEERNHLARELHDDTVQRLAAVHRQLDLLEEDVDEGHSAAVRERLRVVQRMVQESMRNVRNLSRRLRPALLEELGLVPAVEALVADLNRDSDCGVNVSFVVDGEPQRFKPVVELAVYRIAQEAMTNAVKHSDGKEIEVALRLSEEAIELAVKDDGRGFPDTRCTEGERPAVIRSGGMGLIGMRERARSVGATLRIGSNPGSGATIRLLVPLGTSMEQ